MGISRRRTKFEPSVSRVPGFAEFAAKEMGEPRKSQTVWGKCGLVKMKSFRKGPGRDARIKLAVEKLYWIRKKGIELKGEKANIAAESSGYGNTPEFKKALKGSLKSLDGLGFDQVAMLIGEIEANLYRRPLSFSQIAKKMKEDKALSKRLGLSKDRKIIVEPGFVWLIEYLMGARRGEFIRVSSAVYPRFKRLVFKQFDKFGVGIATRLRKKYGGREGVSRKVISFLADEWREKNPYKHTLYKKSTGRSVQSVVRIMWKLKNYNFYGAVQRISFEEAFEGESITREAIVRSYKGNKFFEKLAMETSHWQRLEREKPIPDIPKRFPFGKGFNRLLIASGLTKPKHPQEVKALEKRAKEVLKWLDWSTKHVSTVAEKTSETEKFVKLVNAAFNARTPGALSNNMREFVSRSAERGYGSRRLTKRINAKNQERFGEKVEVSNSAIGKALAGLKKSLDKNGNPKPAK